MPVSRRNALPLLAPLLGLETDERWARPQMDALALRQETLRALVTWLAHTAASTPTLVWVEDLHWADPTTVDLLGLLATESVPGTMILITSRDALDAPWASSVLDIELEPLQDKEAAGLVAALTDGGLDATQAELIVERGAGIPLFLQELTRSTVTSEPGEVLPPRIHEILTARLRAPGIDLRVAQLAAALGGEFDEEPLRELAGRPVDDALARLEEAEIIDRVAEIRLGRFRFRHGLLRDAAYETQLLPSRQATHRRIAELLESRPASPGDLAVVAHHYDLAGDASQSIPAYIEAAQAAQSTASHTEARRLLDRALELAATMPASDERDLTELMIRMQRTVSTSSLYGYGYPEVFDDFTVAEEICRRLTDRPEIMPAQVGIWSYLLVRGSVDAASVVLEPLTDVLDEPATAWFAPEIKSCLGYGAFYQGRLDDAHRWLVEAWEGYQSRSVDAASSPSGRSRTTPCRSRRSRSRASPRCRAARRRARSGNGGPSPARRTSSSRRDRSARPSSPSTWPGSAWSRVTSKRRASSGGARSRSGNGAASSTSSCSAGSTSSCPSSTSPVTLPNSRCSDRAWSSSGTARSAPTYLGIVARNHHYLGDADVALRTVEEAMELTRTSGELVHQPDLLRLRAEITAVAHPERMDEVVTDLVAAVEIGLAQGSLVLALRAANDLARLPHDLRPPDWSDRIRAVLERFPPNSSSPELAEALDLLGI